MPCRLWRQANCLHTLSRRLLSFGPVTSRGSLSAYSDSAVLSNVCLFTPPLTYIPPLTPIHHLSLLAGFPSSDTTSNLPWFENSLQREGQYVRVIPCGLAQSR